MILLRCKSITSSPVERRLLRFSSKSLLIATVPDELVETLSVDIQQLLAIVQTLLHKERNRPFLDETARMILFLAMRSLFSACPSSLSVF